jgi:hypothetical protein
VIVYEISPPAAPVTASPSRVKPLAEAEEERTPPAEPAMVQALLQIPETAPAPTNPPGPVTAPLRRRGRPRLTEVRRPVLSPTQLEALDALHQGVNITANADMVLPGKKAAVHGLWGSEIRISTLKKLESHGFVKKEIHSTPLYGGGGLQYFITKAGQEALLLSGRNLTTQEV